MRAVAICCVWIGLLLLSGTALPAADPMLSHDVYFELKDDSKDAREGPKAFAEKRKPRFVGE